MLTNFQSWDELGKTYDKEKQVEKKFKLVKKDNWYES
jgi:hypothetical protein